MTNNDGYINFGCITSINRPDKLPRTTYVRVAKSYLRKNNPQDAYSILQAAKALYPDDPFVLSYYGSLQAVAGKQYRAGIENCTRAIALLKEKSLVGGDLLFAEFYVNLGRAYAAAGMRREAIRAFHQGLQHEKNNRAILKELRACERRARPFLPFFHRSNLINKYFGMALRRTFAKAL